MTGFFEDHLNMDAIVAFVDGEMSMTAYQRAAAHLVRCPGCAAEVAEQAGAREELRNAGSPRMPGSLAQALCSIPLAMPAGRSSGEAKAPGVGLDPGTGHAIRIDHVGRPGGRKTLFRLGAGALVAGLAVGALAAAPAPAPTAPAPGPSDVTAVTPGPNDPPLASYQR